MRNGETAVYGNDAISSQNGVNQSILVLRSRTNTTQHCSLSKATPCTIKHVRDYFQTGKLPDPGTLCVPPPSPFSLNSTDPGSPFYEPSLGNSISIYDTAFSDLEAKTVEAARGVQRWMARENSFWSMVGAGRVKSLLTSTSSSLGLEV